MSTTSTGAGRTVRAGLLAVLVAVAGIGACGEDETTCMPPAGGLKGGYEVRINGEAFERGSLVLFGGKPIKDVKYLGENAIAVQAPPADEPGAVDIVVTSPTGVRTMFDKAFTYTAMPGLDVESTAAPRAGSGATAAPKPGAEEYKPSGSGGSAAPSGSAAPEPGPAK